MGGGEGMKRYDIRDPRSGGKIKRKICEYILLDDGTETLQFKDGKQRPTITLADFLSQIRSAQENNNSIDITR